ncbi:MAG: hypothetical protein AAF501_05885, partial [Pseudomonadota bacterium]
MSEDAIDPADLPPWTRPDHAIAWHDPAAWQAAEDVSGRALAGTAAAVARLDERLRHLSPGRNAGYRRRLALLDTADLLWSEGLRLRPERLALAEDGRLGRTEDEAHALARATWAVRRLTAIGGAGQFTSTAAVRAFLGLHGHRPDDEAPVFETLWRAVPEPSAIDDWRATLAAATGLHPLSRAAMAFHLWRGFALSPPGELLEAAVAAARIGVPDPGEPGLTGLTVAIGNLHPVATGGDAVARLTGFLSSVSAATGQALAHLDRVADWEAAAHRATQALQGKGAPALID